jgi:hypothetical protein
VTAVTREARRAPGPADRAFTACSTRPTLRPDRSGSVTTSIVSVGYESVRGTSPPVPKSLYQAHSW